MTKQYGRNSWIGLGVVLAAGLIVTVWSKQESPSIGNATTAENEKTPESQPSLTADEFNQFKELVTTLDPEGRLVAGASQWESSRQVDITVANGFLLLGQIKQGEVAIAMRDGLTKVCDCTPFIRFNTAGGQQLIKIGRGQPEYLQ